MHPLTDPSIPTAHTVEVSVAGHTTIRRRDPWRQQASQAAHPSAVQTELPLVEAIAAGLAAVVVPWELDGRSTDAPSNELVLSTEMYDAWVIHWPPGHADDAHAHDGSDGAFAVVSGTLDEERHEVDGSTSTVRISAGGSSAFDAATVHRVVNRARTTATSVHVYSPPLGRPRDGAGGHHTAHPHPDTPSEETT